MRNSGMQSSDLFPPIPNIQQEKNNSFNDLLQTSVLNLSLNYHQSSFEIEDHLPMQASPFQQQPSTYLPQSFLSKPFEEENYDLSSIMRAQTQQQQKYVWNNNYGFNNNSSIQNPIQSGTPLASGQENDPFLSLRIGNQNYWEPFGNDFFDQDFNNNPLINSTYPNIINENISGYFSEMNNNSRRSSNNLINPLISKQTCPILVEGMEEENQCDQNKMMNQTMIEEKEGYDNPIYLKPAVNKIVVDYEKYKEYQKDEVQSTSEQNNPFLNVDKALFPINHFQINEGLESPIPEIIPFSIQLDPLFSDKTYEAFHMLSLNTNTLISKQSLEFQEEQEINSEFRNLFTFDPIQYQINQTQNNISQPSNNIQITQACVCNCKKTKCLKMYCECFSKLGYCGEGCHCFECKNLPEYETEREIAIVEAKQRNPDAFVPKQITEQQVEAKRKINSENQKKGCNCRKTKCLKKYCECFNVGSFCHSLCKCENCENVEGFSQILKYDFSNGNSSVPLLENTSLEQQINLGETQKAVDDIIEKTPFLNISSKTSNQLLFSLNSKQQTISQVGYQNRHTHSSLLGFVHQDLHFLDKNQKPSKYFKKKASMSKNQIQIREMEESENLNSNQNSYSSHQKQNQKIRVQKTKGILAASQKKHSKKLMIKSLDEHSDEDINSTSFLSNSEMRSKQILRIKNRSEACMMQDEDFFLSQQIEDMEKKLKQIKQVKSILALQQQLFDEQEITKKRIINDNLTENITSGVNDYNPSNLPIPQTCSILFEEKALELIRQKKELKLQFKTEQQSDQTHNDNQENFEIILEEGNFIDEQKQIVSNEKQKQKKKSNFLNSQLSGEKYQSNLQTRLSDNVCGIQMIEEDSSSQSRQKCIEVDNNNSPKLDHKQRQISKQSLDIKYSRIRNRLSYVAEPQQLTLQEGISTLSLICNIEPTVKPSELLFDPNKFNEHHNVLPLANIPINNKKKNINFSIISSRQKKYSSNNPNTANL